jgi:hypothetical protein
VKSTLNFKYEFEKYRTVDPSIPEDAVCYDEAFILGLYEKYKLKIKHPVHYGSWCSRPNFLSYQDIIIGLKWPNDITIAQNFRKIAFLIIKKYYY